MKHAAREPRIQKALKRAAAGCALAALAACNATIPLLGTFSTEPEQTASAPPQGQTQGRQQGQTQTQGQANAQAYPALDAPATQNRPAVSGPQAPAPGPGVGPAPADSPWKAALSPFLWQSPAAESAAAPRPSPPLPPVRPAAAGGGARAALLLPLSGRHARLGRAMMDAATLAMFDFGDERLELIVKDTHGTPEGAAAAARQVISDGASIILGPLLAPSVRAAAPAARASGVPMVAFSSDRTVAGPGVFTMGFLPAVEVRAVVRHAAGRGMTRFGLLAPDDAYGAMVSQAFAAAVAETGGQITRTRFYDPLTEDVSGAVKDVGDYDRRRRALTDARARLQGRGDAASQQALKALENLQTVGEPPFDALLVADGGERLQQLAAHLPYYDIDPAQVKMLGTGQWDETGLGAEPALLGGWYAAPSPVARADYEQHFRDTFGDTPPRLTTLVYDALALAAVLARNAAGPDFSPTALTSRSGWAGRDGIFRFGADGLVERGLAVLEVGRRANRVVAPPPSSFSPVIN
ncbi:MAG: penicillin-binding protein activator [Rhodospirillales bacterium]